MKNIIKKGLILLFLNLCLPIPSISQTTSADTLKAISLIFNEHEKFSIENPLLKKQIESLKELNNLYVQSDSIQKIEIDLCKNQIIFNEKTIKKLKSSKKKIIIGSAIGSFGLFILGLLL